MRRTTLGAIAAALCAVALAACGTTTSDNSTKPSDTGGAAKTDGPLQIAFLYNGKINDGGWNTVQDAGRKSLEAEFGDKIQTTFKESVPETPQSTQVIESLIQDGAKLIFSTSFGYHDFIAKAAAKHPDVTFAQFSSTELAPNLTQYALDPGGSWYLAGMALAALSKTGKLGMIAPFPIPQDLTHVNSFTLGVRAVNPKATVKVTWIGSFFDPPKESVAAKALIASGVDALASDMGDPATNTAADKEGVPWVGTVSEQETFGPKTYVTSTLWDWAPIEIKITQSVLDGNFTSENLIMEMKDGVTDVAKWGSIYDQVPDDVKSRIDAKRKAFKAGSESPYAGPFSDQSGKERVAAGDTLSPEKVQQMDYLVEGTIGNTKS
jgi:basic membrane lipoprotein Med (substrate-binding protein (PBP1-ABC) superfamily)